ncbi:hypothetical protein GCM10027589_60090 [Actinocorallia lasiicapitis]
MATAAGARTRWAGVCAGLWLALTVVAAGKYAELIPMPVIGGLILVVGVELILGRVPDIKLVMATSWPSVAAMVATFLATTQLPLQQAIILGAFLSLLLFCGQVARQGRLVRLIPGRNPGHWATAPLPERLGRDEVIVLHYAGASFFAELTRINQDWPQIRDAHGSTLILSLRALPDVPSSTLVKAFHRNARQLQDAGGTLALVGVQSGLRRLLDAAGTTALIGERNLYPADGELFAPLDRAYTDATARAAAP